MKYRLYNPIPSTEYNVRSFILSNRGISEESQKRYFFPFHLNMNPWKLLGEENVRKAADIVYKTLDSKQPMAVIVDQDADGFTSSAIFGNFIYRVNPQYVEQGLLTFLFHDGKAHGLQDMMDKIPPWTKLVVCPDSASSDIEQHKELCECGIDVIVLDHHHCDEVSPYAVVINNQMCDYPNKALTGAGVTWQFCRAYNEIFDLDVFVGYPFLDLCALGCLADMADYREPEIKGMVVEGLSKSKISNPLIQALTEKNEKMMDKRGGYTFMAFAFYVAPYINAICRSGTSEERELVFNAMLEYKAYDTVASTERGHIGEDVPLVREAVRTLLAVKRRQTDLQNRAMDMIEYKVFEDNLFENSVIVIKCDESDSIDPNITGLVANKIQDTYKKPTIILNDNGNVFRGSGRNYGKSPVEDFRKVCEDTERVNFAQGHAGSFGIEVESDMIDEFIDAVNSAYDGIDMTPVYWVDFAFRGNNIPANIVSEIAGMSDLWGQCIPEAFVAIDTVPLSKDNVQLLSADKNPTLKITVRGVEIMKFKSSKEEYEQFTKGNMTLTAVCSCGVNEWMGKFTPQLIVEDFELREEWVF